MLEGRVLRKQTNIRGKGKWKVQLWANLENLSSTFPDSKLNPVGIVKNFEAGPENHSNHSPIQITTKLWFWDRPILQKTEVSIERYQ